MPTIYAIGETIYDIIFSNNEPVAAKAGGAMLNTTVSLGRLGLPVEFVSELGDDPAGNIISSFLNHNGVSIDLAYRYAGKTIIALAFLQENNDARYSFYKPEPDTRLQIELPAFEASDIVLFGAFYSLTEGIRRQLIEFVEMARDAGALIVYDPNIRSPHKNEIESLRELIYENFSLSDIVRGSDEDFMTMFDIRDGNRAYEMTASYGCKYLVYTKSNIGVEIYSPDGMTEVPVPSVATRSTIGAGDSFNAGLIYELYQSGLKPGQMQSYELRKMVKTAVSFGSHVCTHYDNYISEEFAEKMK